MVCGIGCGSSERIWSMKVLQQSLRGKDTSKSSRELPMEPRAEVELGSGKHSVYTHFPKDPNRDICLKTKITRPRAEHFGDLITADHKIISEESESRIDHRYAVVAQDLATQWIQSYPCKTKTSQETHENLMKFLEPTRKPEVIKTWLFLRIWQILWRTILESLQVNATQIGKLMGLLKEQCAEWRKRHLLCCCNQVWMKIGGRIPWSVIAICETFKTCCLMGRHHMKGGSECHLADQWYRLEQWSLRKTSLDCISLEQKSCQVNSLDMALHAGETLERRHLGRRHWAIGAEGTRPKSVPQDSMQRKCWRRKEVETSCSQSADGTVKIFGVRLASENIHLNPGLSGTRRRTRNSRKIRWITLSNPTSRWLYTGCCGSQKLISGLRQEISFVAITCNPSQTVRAERRIISYSDEVHRRYQNNIYTSLDCSAGENIKDYWNVDGERELSDAWTGFTRFILLIERPDNTWSGWRPTRKQPTSRPDNVWLDMWKHVSDASKQKSEAKVDHRETKAR